jgi:PAS domain S-box-containing protein
VQSTTVDVLHVSATDAAADLHSDAYRVHHVTDIHTARDVLARANVDVVVHDATPGPPNGDIDADRDHDALAALAADAPDVPLLARTPDPDGRYASDATAAGATGYCTFGDDLATRIDDSVDQHPPTEENWYRRLFEAVTDGTGDFETTVERLLEVGCERLDLPYGFLTRIDEDDQHIAVAVGDHDEIQTGAVAPLADSYCQYTLDTDGGYLALDDAETQLPADDPFERFELGCYLGGVVEIGDEAYGSLCFAGDDARALSFDDDDRSFVEFTVERCEHELARGQYRSELEDARERYERVVERIDDAFFALDDDWTFTYVNQRASDLLDADPNALVGEHIWDAYPSEYATRFRERYERAMRDQTPVVFEEYFDPLSIWLEVSAYPAADGLSVFFKDVSDRKRRERQLTRLLELMRDLFGKNDPDAIASHIVDATKDVLGHDYVVVRLHDDDENTLPVVAHTDPVDTDLPDRPTYEPGDPGAGEAYASGDAVEREVDGATAVGPLTSALYLPLGDHGVITIAIRHDDTTITETERQLAEILATNATAALSNAERQRVLERYETVLENVQDMVFVLDDDGTFEYVTEPLAETVGRDRNALVGRHASELVDATPDAVDASIQELLSSDETAMTFHFDLQTTDGIVPIEVDGTVLPGDREGFVGVVHDISDLTETRARLETENARFRQLFESLPDPVVENRFVDGEPIVDRVNPAFEDVFGFDADTVVGECINDIIVPEDRHEEAESLDSSAAAVDRHAETVVSREVVRQTETGPRYFLFRGISYLDGDIHRGYGIYTDITHQHERERRLQVLHTILRHNLRTEMTLVSGYVDQLEDVVDEHDLTARIKDVVDEVLSLSDKARELEHALGETPDPERVDVRRHVQKGVADAIADHPGREVDLDATAVTAIADHRLAVVVENLVENAFQHGDGTVTVDVVVDADAVRIAIADEGSGVPAFERELVTGDRDITQLEHGSGLGLWISTWLLDAFGGYLEFEDDPSAVVAVLPRAADD